MRRFISLAALLPIALLSSAFAPVPQPKAAKGDLAAMQGTWVLVSSKVGGRNVLRTWKITVAGTRLKYLGDEEGDVEYAVTLNPGKSPNQYELRDPRRPLTAVGTGIYRLEGDTLKLCYNGRALPPTAFDGSKPGETLEVYKRQKP